MSNILLALILAQTAPLSAPVSKPVPRPAACQTAEYRAFDFWIGEWDVYPNGKDAMVARSRIENMYGGCAIRENWMPLKGAGGGSLSNFEPATGRWHQYWVDNSGGGAVNFDGGVTGGKMVLTGFWRGSGAQGKDGITRMTYSLVDDDTVRQLGEVSIDHGLSWTVSFDFHYRRRKDS